MTALAARLRAMWLWPVTIATVLLLLASCSPRPPHPLPAPSQMVHDKGRLWRVEGRDIAPSHVFGTFQIYDERLLALQSPVEEAFVDAQVLAVEDFGGLYERGGIYNVDTLKLPEGESLDSLIGGRSFGILTWHMERSELRPKDNIKPWAFWLYMGGLNWGFVDYTSGYDYRASITLADSLQVRARREKKQVVDLETVRERFDIVDKLPLDAQADMLKVVLDRYSKRAPRVEKAQLYLDGDLATLDALWREYLGWHHSATAAVLDDRLINDRNPLLVQRMILRMREASTFVAVDVRHLPGENGILRLLERQGYAVTRLQ
jgi:uncharacterized protein